MSKQHITRKRGAIFCDMYGTLAFEVGYPNHPHRLQLYPWTIPTLQKVQRNNYHIVVVTNQANVTRGYTTQKVLDAIFYRLHALLAMDGIYATSFYCDSIDEAHPDRKPNPGMAHKAAETLDISLTEDDNWIIGDSIKDLVFGVNAGFRNPPCFVLTGYGRGIYEYQYEKLKSEVSNVCIFTNAEAAVDSIILEKA